MIDAKFGLAACVAIGLAACGGSQEGPEASTPVVADTSTTATAENETMEAAKAAADDMDKTAQKVADEAEHAMPETKSDKKDDTGH